MAERSPDEMAEVVREYGPFGAGEPIHGVSFDGERVWLASGNTLRALDPARGEITRQLSAPCDAGTAFDGKVLYQLGAGVIRKLDPQTGETIATLPIPADTDSAGLTWAEGKLWLAKYRGRKILQLDPETGAVLKTLESNRFVTGVTWVDGELWHGTLEDDVSELRRVAPDSGEVLVRLSMPEGMRISGLESDRGDLFYCGGGSSGKLRAVRRPRTRREEPRTGASDSRDTSTGRADKE